MKRTVLITLFCCVLVVGVSLFDSRVKHEGQVTRIRNNFRQIQIALAHYRDAYSCFPPSQMMNREGTAVGSWRQPVLSYLESGCEVFPLDWKANSTWNDPEFMRFDEVGICLTAPFFYSAERASQQEFETNVLALTGAGTAFEFLQNRASNQKEKVTTHSSIPGDTIVIAEANHSGIHYRQPGDLDIRTMPREINPKEGVGISSALGDRFHVGFVDGEVWAISSEVPFETLEKFFTVEGAERWNRDELLGPYRVK